MRTPAVTSPSATPAAPPGHQREGAITERPPLGYLAALKAVIRCAASTARLLRRRRIHTPLFAGFPGLVSKLWLAAEERGRYQGLYEWDGPRRAEAYARALWRVLALVSVPGSIHYIVLPGLRRNQVLARPQALADPASAETEAWWRIVEVS
jgi:hypothetical protein